MNEKEKVSMADFKQFVSNLSNAHDAELQKMSDELVDKYNYELQEWFFGHIIVDSES